MGSDPGMGWCGTDYQRYNMNERIKELLQEAYTHFGHGKYRTNELVAEKFAELMVKECADIALKSGNVANKNIAAKIESERIYHKIREYFGVE